MSVIIGSVGVGLLLVAFFLSLFGMLDPKGTAYSALNVVGAGLSCYASVLIDYVPFIILEGVWGLVALVGMVRSMRRNRSRRSRFR